MSSEKVNETKETDDAKPSPLLPVLKSRSKDTINEEISRSKRVAFQEKPVIINKTVSKTNEAIKTDVNELEKPKEKKDRVRPPTKVVVRRLPPTMTLDVFIDYVSPLPEHDYIYFVPADMNMGMNAFSRVYINFVNMADLITFHEQFDNYVFMDNKGNEYPAVVEFAPFQRIPKKRLIKKRDLKAGTLKDDPEYIAFLESLKEKKEAALKHSTIDVAVPPEKPLTKITTTPLLEYIKQRRAEQQKVRDEKREERRRKELERKRMKDEEKKRRKDGESILKVLRNNEPDDSEDNKSVREPKEKDWSPSSQSSKRKQDDKLQQRDEKRKERIAPDNRIRDTKIRETGPKSYRDERQKLVEGRIQRKLADDQRKKNFNDRSQSSSKSSDAKNAQETEKNSFLKDNNTVKHSQYKEVKEIDIRRVPSNKHSTRESEKFTKEVENGKAYQDGDRRKSEKKVNCDKDTENWTFAESDDCSKCSSDNVNPWKELTDTRCNLKESGSDHSVAQTVSEVSEIQKEDSFQLEDDSDKSNTHLDGEKFERYDKKTNLKRSSSVGRRENRKGGEEKMGEKVIFDIDTKAAVTLQRSSSLDLSSNAYHCMNKEKKIILGRKSEFTRNMLLTEDSSLKNIGFGSRKYKSQEFGDSFPRKCVVTHRRNSLETGDSYKAHLMMKQNVYSERSNDLDKRKTDNKDTTFEVKAKCDSNSFKEGKEYSEEEVSSKIHGNKISDAPTIVSGSDAESKRDPRMERRIRNKDRPSIEIYRPGMGRFSMQRKEREKSAVVTSNLDQDSPSTSPSPSPSIRPVSASRSRAGQELRSMTFKRSVSREK